METLQGARFRFGKYDLDCLRRRLTRDGVVVALKPKAFDLLQYLVENHGKLITKNELMEHIWPGQFVEDNNLTVQISSLRKAFQDNNDSPIKTVPGVGYTFVADVFDLADDTKLIIEQRSISRMIIEESEPISATSHSKQTLSRMASRSRAFTVLALSISAILVVSGFVYVQSRNSPDNSPYKLSKLTSSGDVTSATITPDGNYAVYARKESGGESLWLRQIETGSQQKILEVKPVRFVGLAISPDNSLIYATTFSPTLPDPQIWRMPLLGGVVEPLANVTTGAAISFSPDGKKIAYTESRSSMKETQLLTSDADGSNKRVVARAADDKRSFPNFNLNPVAWSPDGSVIAASVGERSVDIKHGILLIDPQTGAERFITDRRWDFIDDLTWIDNEELAFIAYSVAPSLRQIWSVSRSGEVRQITNDLSDYSWLAGARGGLLTVQRNPASRVSIIDIAEKTGLASTREILNESGMVENVAFAADGTIVYSSTANGGREIWRVTADGSQGKPITSNANVTFGMSVSSAEGSIVFCSTEGGKHVLKLADADGSNIRALTEGPDDVNPEFTADGRSIVFQKGLYNKLVTLWRLDLSDGSRTQLTETFAAKPALSRDGSKIAYYFMDQEKGGIWTIGLVSVSNGLPQGKLDFPRSISERHMRWHPDGTSIAQIFNTGDAINLLLMPFNGAAATSLTDLAKGEVQGFRFSPDGRKIVMAHSQERRDLIRLAK